MPQPIGAGCAEIPRPRGESWPFGHQPRILTIPMNTMRRGTQGCARQQGKQDGGSGRIQDRRAGGCGIGPEITDATIEVLQAASERTRLKLSLTHCLVGWKAKEREGTLLSEATEQTLRASDWLDHGADLRRRIPGG